VHLRCMSIRERAGLRQQTCVVSEDAEYLGDLPAEFASLYSVVPQSAVRELLEVDDDRYSAVLTAPAGVANSALLCQQVLAHLMRTHGEHFVYADCTNVDRIVVDEAGVVAHAGGCRVKASHVVLCTNGFVDHRIEDAAGSPVFLARDQQITGQVAFMAAFVEEAKRAPAAISYVRNVTIGGDSITGNTPYVYVTRRTYDWARDTVTLTCMGGPESGLDGTAYRRDAPVPGDVLQAIDDEVRPFAQPRRLPGQPYEFHWHGLMAYNDSLIRVIGPHPHHPPLLYNLGCNGVGFLPSIHGGHSLARLLAGDRPTASVFDPR
jgi:glycine/D-amino acid oxidase-like deaminating enzyme